MSCLFLSAFRSLGRKKSRTLLTILGIAIGVASVTLISSISQCGTDAISTELESLGLSGLTISTSQTGGYGPPLREEELAVVEACEGVEAATPVLVQTAEISSKRYETQAIAWGIDVNADEIISLEVLYGRMFERSDIRAKANVCLVDEAFARNAYARSNIIYSVQWFGKRVPGDWDCENRKRPSAEYDGQLHPNLCLRALHHISGKRRKKRL